MDDHDRQWQTIWDFLTDGILATFSGLGGMVHRDTCASKGLSSRPFVAAASSG